MHYANFSTIRKYLKSNSENLQLHPILPTRTAAALKDIMHTEWNMNSNKLFIENHRRKVSVGAATATANGFYFLPLNNMGK